MKAEFFRFSQGSRVPVLDGRRPTVVKIAATVIYSNTGSRWPGLSFSDHFAARWTGYLKVATTASYDFQLRSDDGSLLFVDGSRVVDNDGLHGLRARTGILLWKAWEQDTKLE